MKILKFFKSYCWFCLAADEEFDELCFKYGLELDEVVSYRIFNRL